MSATLRRCFHVTTLASPGDMLLFDILSRTLLEAPYMANQLSFSRVDRRALALQRQRTRGVYRNVSVADARATNRRVCTRALAVSDCTARNPRLSSRAGFFVEAHKR